MSDRLGSAQWEESSVVSEKYPFAEGKFWLGRAEDATAIGYRDDRHVCLVSGNRGGKGTSIIVNNLCFWPGSAVVVDPKGENATVTAARRGQGSEHCAGMGQAVHVLDPFTTASVDDCYRSSFNPLDDLDPKSEETIDEAKRLADALVVVDQQAHEKFFDEAARSMIHGIILYVLTARHFMKDERNLLTVRDLILRGEWQLADTLRAQGYKEETIDPPHLILWRKMEKNPSFNGVVAGIGARFRAMMKSAEKTYEGILQSIVLHTEFLDSPGMRRVLTKSNFKLSELKTRPEGMTLYMSLPQRYMSTHSRWLRMMVALTINEMEITRGQPASGHPVLMVLDEFKSLKRMDAIENAVAQIAGFGVKLFFVLQSLEQLKDTYKDNWETFLANAGVKIFFSVEDHFTREYVSKLVGETEIIRELRSSNQSQSENESFSEGTSQSQTVSQSTSKSKSRSQTHGTSDSVNQSRNESVNKSRSLSESFGTNESFGWSFGKSSGVSRTSHSARDSNGSGVTIPDNTFSDGENSSTSGSRGSNRGMSQSNTEGFSSGTSSGSTFGKNKSRTHGTSYSETRGTSSTTGTSQTYTKGSSRTSGTGSSESVHRRPLIQPDEVGRIFTRIDDKDHPAFPGLALVIVTGANPMVLKRAQYFEDGQFIDCFSPHPDHLPFLAANTYEVGERLRILINVLETGTRGYPLDTYPLTIAEWLVGPGDGIAPAQPVARIERVPPDNRTVYIEAPCSGKVISTVGTPENRLRSGEYSIPDGPAFTIRSYTDEDDIEIDPLRQLDEADAALSEFLDRPEPSFFQEFREFLKGEGTSLTELAFGILFFCFLGLGVFFWFKGAFGLLWVTIGIAVAVLVVAGIIARAFPDVFPSSKPEKPKKYKLSGWKFLGAWMLFFALAEVLDFLNNQLVPDPFRFPAGIAGVILFVFFFRRRFPGVPW